METICSRLGNHFTLSKAGPNELFQKGFNKSNVGFIFNLMFNVPFLMTFLSKLV